MTTAETDLKSNEFEAIALLYDKPSDEGRIIESGALAGSSGRLIVVHWEHHCPIGIAKLTELPGIGVHARGRLAVLTATGLYVANGIQQGAIREVCLSSKTIRASRTVSLTGAVLDVVHEAQALELSICLRGGIPGTGICAWGGIDLTEDEWTRKFFPEGLEMLRAEEARTLEFFAAVRKQNTIPWNEENYERWIETMSF